MKAIIYKSTGSWYLAKTEQGAFWKCRIKGRFKIDKEITSTNPIAVGDVVDISIEDEVENTAMIETILIRKNYIVRVSPHNKNQKHIVASNLSQSIIVATLRDPKTSTGFIDRYLVTCEVYHIPAIIVFNKSDLLDADDMLYYEHIRNIYTHIGYRVLLLSAEKNEGLNELNNLLKDKVTLFTGHSGVGKSTLVNKLIPTKNITVHEVSDWSGKGMHTTTFAEMHDLPQGGQLIDTPGIRELGIVNVSRAELGGYFPEIRKIALDCKYNNCIHYNEPGCAVKQAVNDGVISEERFVSYLKIKDTIEEKWGSAS